uniref:Biogenesis of lysosome-related organelles complex 1 subunit 5 n=1 Tax=Ficedula albicollis TaxID=59894 RepID=A0A803VEU7_FICAL
MVILRPSEKQGSAWPRLRCRWVPVLQTNNGPGLTGLMTIAAHLVRQARKDQLLGSTAEEKAVVQQWLEYRVTRVNGGSSKEDTRTVLKDLNMHLEDKVYLAGNIFTLADILMYYGLHHIMEKRGLRELRVLENLKNTIFETNERVLPKCEQAMQDNLSETFKRLQAANAMMHRLQEREYEARKMGSPVAIEYWYWANSTRLSTDRVCFVSNTRVDTQRASGRQGDGS